VILMPRTIRIKAGSVEAVAELNDSKTAAALWDALPITGRANIWGDEIYFSIPVQCKPENGQALVQMGDLGYWPPGSAFCIFFGRTPASQGDEIRPASPVNVFGRVVSPDPTAFKNVGDGEKVEIAAAEEATS
jgi:hypothetical protein